MVSDPGRIPCAEIFDRLMARGDDFHAVDLLLEADILQHRHYSAWQTGAVSTLDRLFTRDAGSVIAFLHETRRYAGGIGLDVIADSWPPGATPGRRMSMDRELNGLLAARFCATEADPQRDLFSHNPATQTANDLTRAILARRASTAAELLEKLGNLEVPPDLVDGFATLVAGLETMTRPAAGSLEELRWLEGELTHDCERILRTRSADYLDHARRWLAAARSDLPFDPAQPELHESALLAKGGDWQRVREACEADDAWRHHAELGIRLGAALHALGEGALPTWIELAWLFPAEVEASLNRGDHVGSEVDALWRGFLAVEDEVDLEEPMAFTLFPAWILLRNPALTRCLPERGPARNDRDADAFRAAHQLAVAVLSGNEALAHRAALGRASPALLKCYLAGRP